MKPIIDHIQITVKDLKIAEPFYDRLLLVLGFEIDRKTKAYVAEHEFEVVEYFHPLLIFGINSPRKIYRHENIHRRKPGSIHHLAFKASSREEVDRLYPEIVKTGAQIVEKPKFYPQHGKCYYALFFKDLEGIKYEIVFEERD